MEQALIHPETTPRPAALSKAEMASWGQSLMAGLPHLLYPLVVYSTIPRFAAYRTSNGYLFDPLTLLFWIIILAGLAFAWRSRWPRWSATWIGFGLVVAVELMVVMPSTGSYDRAAVFSGALWLALTLAVLILVARRDWLDGLLAVLPLVPMWYTYLALDGVIGNEAPIFYIDGVIMAIMVAWIVRRGSPFKGVLLILAAITLVGLPVAYATVYYSNARSAEGLPPTPEPAGVVGGYLAYLIGYAVLSAPVLLTALVRWRRRANG